MQGESIKKGYEMIVMNGKKNGKIIPLIEAAKNCDLDLLKKYLDRGDNICELENGSSGPNALHWAAYNDDHEKSFKCVEELIKRATLNSNSSLKSTLINGTDTFKQTPIFWAAQKGNKEVVKLLVENGCELGFGFQNETIFHTLAKSDFKYHDEVNRCAEYLLDETHFKKGRSFFLSYLDGERDKNKRTALMNAAIAGNHTLLQLLIKAGANATKTDFVDSNVFHYAAGNAIESRAVSCVRALLVDSLKNDWNSVKKRLLESFDISGKMPVHIAGRRGYAQVLLMLKDTIHFSEGKTGLTPLHSAASLGNQHKAKICVETILEISNDFEPELRSELLNAQDQDGCIPLYLSAQNRNIEACKLLLLAESKFDIKTKRGKSSLEKVYEKIPQAVSVLLDKAVLNSGYVDHLGSVNAYAQLDFGPILGYNSSKENIYKETEELAKVCYAKFEDRKAILDNTFIKIFIFEKWKKVKWFFFTFRIIHIIWFFLNFLLIVNVFRVNCPYADAKVFSWTSLRPPSETENKTISKSLIECKPTNVLKISGCLNLVALLIYILSQFHQTKQRFHWIFRPLKSLNKNETNFIESTGRTLFYYIRIFLKILPCWPIFISIGISCCTLPSVGVLIFDETTHYLLAGVTGLFIWLAIYVELGKFPQFRVYINLLMRSTTTLLLAIAVTAPILFGFATVFVVLMPGEPSFSSAAQSFVKVITFMIGELDYESLFYGDRKENIFSGFVMLALAIFIVIIVVLLVNFLIGLAAEEIRDFWERAEIWKLCTQLEQIVMLESFLDETVTFCGRGFLKRNLMLMPPIIENDEIVEQRRSALIYIPQLPQNMQKELHELNMKTIEQVNYF